MGTLSLVVSGNGVDTITSQIPVAVNKLPDTAGIISGESEVCLSQNGVNYEIMPVLYATSYKWEYTGKVLEFQPHQKRFL